MHNSRTNIRLCFLALACLLSGCGKGPDDGLIKLQVSGQVLLNGTPQPGIAVCFNHTDAGVKDNASRPVAVTNEEGRFALSTNGPQDGAIAGDYVVTFFWPEGGTSTRDFLNGRYTNQQASPFKVTIGKEDTVLTPFELEAPPQDVEAAKRALALRAPQN